MTNKIFFKKAVTLLNFVCIQFRTAIKMLLSYYERSITMKKSVKLETIFESQAFAPQDELTALLKSTEQLAEDELSFDELDTVAAASAEPSFTAFKDYLNAKHKK